METTSSPLNRRKAGAAPLWLWLGMAVVLLCIAADSCAGSTLPLPDRSNGVKEGRDKFYCFRGYKRCMSGIKQCIKPDQECDGIKDCADGSDEGHRCKSFDCTAVFGAKCPSGRICMNVTGSAGHRRYSYDSQYLCDGVKDCADGSDEDPSLCASYDCKTNMSKLVFPLHQYRRRCPGGKGGCVTEAQLCDGVVNCVGDGGSDESDKYCKKRGCSPSLLTSLFQCRSGRCIKDELVCDGKRDCPDGDDEGELCEKMDCPYGRVKCSGGRNRTCILRTQVCDGVEDCPGGTDEKQCNSSLSCAMHGLGSLCPSGKQCASFTRCDGVKECRDGSDEDPKLCRTFNCSYNEVKCKDGLTCIKDTELCDGHKNCPDKSDEDPVFCRTHHNCTLPTSTIFFSYSLRLKCPGSAYVWCTTVGRLCDGLTRDCYENEDENPKFCSSDKTRNLLAANGLITCLSNTTRFTYGYYCDGIYNCFDQSDERHDFCKGYKCPAGRVKCYGKWCAVGKRCDGKRDCPDGSDEKGCRS